MRKTMKRSIKKRNGNIVMSDALRFLAKQFRAGKDVTEKDLSKLDKKTSNAVHFAATAIATQIRVTELLKQAPV